MKTEEKNFTGATEAQSQTAKRHRRVERYVVGAVSTFGAMPQTEIVKCLSGYYDAGCHPAEIGAAIKRLVDRGELEVRDNLGPRGGKRYEPPNPFYQPYDPKCRTECRHCGGLT